MDNKEQDTIKTETPILSATPAATDKIKELLAEKELTDHGLRIFVAGIGCSGFQYGLGFEDNPRESDTIIEADGIKLIIDPQSLLYMRGSSVDFVETPNGGGFSIDNPNAATLCGTGCSGCG